MANGGWLKVLIVTSLLTLGSVWAYASGRTGRGLPGALDEPVKVDVREGSTSGGRGATFIYFGSGRRYRGGGPSFGK